MGSAFPWARPSRGRADPVGAPLPWARRSRGRGDLTYNDSHSDVARTKTYGVNVPFMQLERHGWDIHAVSAGRSGTSGLVSLVTKVDRERRNTNGERPAALRDGR